MFDYSDEAKKRADATKAEMLEKPERKIKVPKTLAVIDQSGCTGCEACVQFCPVDCIELVPGPEFPDMNKFVEVDLDRCIGCKLCAKYCPWDTIHMVPNAEAEDKANEWTLRSVILPGGEGSIWPFERNPEAAAAEAAAASAETADAPKAQG
jgi:formate hydrogenlyase subunit 6/NADH:ubiquinone oxidoreductase subunit I